MSRFCLIHQHSFLGICAPCEAKRIRTAQLKRQGEAEAAELARRQSCPDHSSEGCDDALDTMIMDLNQKGLP